MELINQPFTGQLGNRLVELLAAPDYHTLNIAVAFAKNSGVLRIKEALSRFRKRGGKVNAIVGIDLGGTSYEALTALLLHTDSLSVVHSESGQTFHSKIYHFLGENTELIIVGSHNLTGGGLWTNFESSVLISVSGNSGHERQLGSELDHYFRELNSLNDSFMSIDEQEDIDHLLRNGYIFKEVAEQLRRARAAANVGGEDRLFGNGAPAKIPAIATAGKAKEVKAHLTSPELILVPRGDEGPTIWFETRRMTGGSRNILDLSMKSLIEHGDPVGTPFNLDDPKFMRGGVEFFGLNPTATDQVKNLTINFDGLDYTGNTILFPVGENANGTWRLQIKGKNSSEGKITDAFKAKGADYLVQKIIAFTKIQSDYYFMSVFPDSELENFKAASSILARNGASTNAKLLGLL